MTHTNERRAVKKHNSHKGRRKEGERGGEEGNEHAAGHL